MRHLSFSLLASALVFYGCSKTPEPEVQEEEIYLESGPVTEMTDAPAVAPVAAPKAAKTKAVVAPEQPRYEVEEPVIQEEEVIFIEEDSGPGEVQRTYNERQISDEKGDFPLYESNTGKTYNESQVSD